MEEKELIKSCKTYLKEVYDEDTEWIRILKNEVVKGTGVLSVDCKVILNGKGSEWHKKFYFENGKIVDMNAKRKN